MRSMIDEFRIVPAGHCGSGAMRNLIYHYCGLDLDEGVVFGLGAGLDTVYFDYPDAQPPFMLFGRGSTMEADLAETLGLDYHESIQTDNELAWAEVREEILAGRPTMLSGDIYYLDYREFKVHFPAHRFILLGFDEEKGECYIADRVNEHPEICSLEALAKSRNPASAISTHNLWGKFSSSAQRNPLPLACGIALRKTVERMQGIDQSQRTGMAAMTDSPDSVATGLEGLRTFIERLGQWSDLPDAADHAQYVDNAIIKFGTGGGFFRNHFAIFMQWAKKQRPDLVTQTTVDLAEQAASEWNGLSPTMQLLINRPGDQELWQQAKVQGESIFETEYALFNFLGDTVLRDTGS
jgi:hypothetical protein